MAFRSMPIASEPARHSRRQMAVVRAALLLIALGVANNAFAAVDCGPKMADHAAATQCRGHHPRTGVRKHAKARNIVKATAGRVAEGEKLTPANPATAEPNSTGSELADVLLPASVVVHRLARIGGGPSPWSARGAPAGNRWPASADAPNPTRAPTAAAASRDSAPSLGDIARGGGGMPAVPAPIAWAILLAGVLGLRVLTRPPRVARVRSWADTSSRAAWSLARAKASRSALDRVDPERYARVEVRRQGHFVRVSGANHFGADR
jgi:hypothetical protein